MGKEDDSPTANVRIIKPVYSRYIYLYTKHYPNGHHPYTIHVIANDAQTTPGYLGPISTILITYYNTLLRNTRKVKFNPLHPKSQRSRNPFSQSSSPT